MTRVSVDPDLCVGTGDCARLAPQAFALESEDATSEVLEGAQTTDLELLRRVARNCPTRAIRVEDDEAAQIEAAETEAAEPEAFEADARGASR